MDESGEVIVPFIDEEAMIFMGGRVLIKRSEEKFYIDSKGTRID